MSRMSEQAAEQDERENLSGADTAEHEQWWEKNQRLLKGFEELRPVFGEYKHLNDKEKQND